MFPAHTFPAYVSPETTDPASGMLWLKSVSVKHDGKEGWIFNSLPHQMPVVVGLPPLPSVPLTGPCEVGEDTR